tara:strand:- start:90 stop:317 length:228 start_codon:yes stop_codon:yes gene_type:complete
MGNRVKKNMGTSNVGGIKVQDTQLMPYPTQKMGPSVTLKMPQKKQPKRIPYGMKKGPIKQKKQPKRIPYGHYIER